ncbi:MAG: hypothetical protein RJA98_2578 [Pseudomonadota bacterium]|jgi:hypothetical protein
MRPAGEIRAGLRDAAAQLAQQHEAFTRRDLVAAARLQVGGDVARATIENMVRRGELERVGQQRVPGVCRPVTLYAPRRMRQTSMPDLARVTRGWVQSW